MDHRDVATHLRWAHHRLRRPPDCRGTLHEIARCLKRYIAREVHRAITRPLPLTPRGAMLRDLRTQAGLPLRVVAEQHGITAQRLSRIERGLTRDPALQTQIHTWLTTPDMIQIAA